MPVREHTQSKFFTGLIAATLALACALPALAQSLSDTMQRRIDRAGLGQINMGVSVIDLDTGRTIVNLDADTARTPASNMKILTSACALLTLGPDFAFRTEIQLDGDRLIVVGAGDPALGDPDLLKALTPAMTPDDLLTAIATSIADTGVTTLSEIVVDDRIFIYEGAHPAWPADQLHRWYCAEVAGINFNTNVLDVFARPQRLRGGAPARAELSITPTMPWLSIDNRVQTINDRERQSGIDTLRPEVGVNRLLVIGQVSVPAGPAHVSVYDPALWFGQLLADRLAAAGITVGKGGGSAARHAVRRPDDGEEFAGANPLVAISTPLDEILLRCNRDSQNLYAEALLKRIAFEITGQPGSWASGTDVMRMMLVERLGTRLSAALRISDGSGMSRDNKVSPAAITHWLRLVDGDATIRDDMRRSLVTPGTGTLRRRFSQGPENTMLAKTGLLNGVRALSGYIESPQGPAVAFSILMDDIPPALGPAARRTIDELALDIDAWISQQAARQPALGG